MENLDARYVNLIETETETVVSESADKGSSTDLISGLKTKHAVAIKRLFDPKLLTAKA